MDSITLHVGYQSSVTKQASKEKHEPSLQGNLRTGSRRIARVNGRVSEGLIFPWVPKPVVELASGIWRGAKTDGCGEREKETACNRNRRGSTTLQETTGRRKRGNHVEGAQGGVGEREGEIGGLSKASAVSPG